MSANIAEQEMVSEGAVIAPMYVINLCASTSPMALTHPSTPELKRYTFFVTRQREDGRERFRLHMGYFPTQQEAESLLAKVRDIYPAAWAGPAPSTPAALRRARAEITAVPTPAPVLAAVAAPAEPAVLTAPAAIKPAVETKPVVETKPARAAAALPTLDAMSNVRDVLALLSDATPTAIPAMPVAKSPAPTPTLAPAPAAAPRAADEPPIAVKKATPAPAKAAAPVAKPAPAVEKAAPPAPAKPLNSHQTVDVLEFSMAPESAPRKPETGFRPFGEEADDGQVRLVTPEDTQTLRDIRLDAQTNAPPCFAVQLVWSVTPIDITKQAHLAIFDAYTLYNVEGNRQGRRWYGLRLGFFSDPNSATQVAYYVRSDYPKVAVVPVATKERERADVGKPAGKARLGEPSHAQKPEAQTAIEKQGLVGFELLKDDRPPPPKRDVGDSVPGNEKSRAAIAQAISRTGPGKATGKPTGKRVVARPRTSQFKKTYAPGAATPLESTLEILGASTLTLDEGREIINDSAIRAPVKKKLDSATGRFARLLGKLSNN